MKIKKILVSQPEPADLEKSPYKNLVTKYGVDITFFKFFEVVGLTVSEFRKSRIHLTEYTAVIFNSKNSIDHFFRLAKELREVIPDSMKYFCTSEAIAHYLQNYIQYLPLPLLRREADRIHQDARQGQVQIHQGHHVHLRTPRPDPIQPQGLRRCLPLLTHRRPLAAAELPQRRRREHHHRRLRPLHPCSPQSRRSG